MVNIKLLRKDLSYYYVGEALYSADRTVFLRPDVQKAFSEALGTNYSAADRNLLYNLYNLATENSEAPNVFRKLNPDFLVCALQACVANCIDSFSHGDARFLSNTLSVLSGQNGSPRWQHWTALESGFSLILGDSLNSAIDQKIRQDKSRSFYLGKDRIASVISALAKFDGLLSALTEPTARYLEYKLNRLPEISEFHTKINHYLRLQEIGADIYNKVGTKSTQLIAEDFSKGVYNVDFLDITGGRSTPLCERVLSFAHKNPSGHPNIICKIGPEGVRYARFLPTIHRVLPLGYVA